MSRFIGRFAVAFTVFVAGLAMATAVQASTPPTVDPSQMVLQPSDFAPHAAIKEHGYRAPVFRIAYEGQFNHSRLADGARFLLVTDEVEVANEPGEATVFYLAYEHVFRTPASKAQLAAAIIRDAHGTLHRGNIHFDRLRKLRVGNGGMIQPITLTKGKKSLYFAIIALREDRVFSQLLLASKQKLSPKDERKLAGDTTAHIRSTLATPGTPPPGTFAFPVPSEEMQPTLRAGQTLSVDPNAYDTAPPAINDVVVFHPSIGATPSGSASPECGAPHSAQEACPQPMPVPSMELFVGRVVAGPGDTVSINHGVLIVNGEKRAEPFLCPEVAQCNLPNPITIPAGDYFLLGDNRGVSNDSRLWGPVPESWIVGHVVGHS